MRSYWGDGDPSRGPRPPPPPRPSGFARGSSSSRGRGGEPSTTRHRLEQIGWPLDLPRPVGQPQKSFQKRTMVKQSGAAIHQWANDPRRDRPANSARGARKMTMTKPTFRGLGANPGYDMIAKPLIALKSNTRREENHPWFEEEEDRKEANTNRSSRNDGVIRPARSDRRIAMVGSSRNRPRPFQTPGTQKSRITNLARSGNYRQDGRYYPEEAGSNDGGDSDVEIVREFSRSPSPGKLGSPLPAPTQNDSSKSEGKKKARESVPVSDVIEISDSSDIDMSAPHNDGPSISRDGELEELTSRLEAFRYRDRKLPFLRRNLRVGFEGRCIERNISIAESPPPSPSMIILYRQNDDGECIVSSRDELFKWECPICDVHRQFNNRDMLAYHFQKDHVLLEAEWKQTKGSQWIVILNIPPAPPLSDIFDSGSSDEESEDDILQGDSPEAESGKEDETGPSSNEPSIVPVPISAKLRMFSPTPAAIPLTNQDLRGSLPSRYPTPPPPHDKLGPAAQYPFLDYQDKIGEMAAVPDKDEPEDMYHQSYSCRPGGPRIYDLLNTLDMERFGVLSWLIVDREEEIYEIDDIRDEDKVMHVLWNRWVFLNRKLFVFKGYHYGVEMFLKEYWKVIHLTAGWGALREFLLMLYEFKYLTIPSVAELLKFYESKTGMELWYK